MSTFATLRAKYKIDDEVLRLLPTLSESDALRDVDVGDRLAFRVFLRSLGGAASAAASSSPPSDQGESEDEDNGEEKAAAQALGAPDPPVVALRPVLRSVLVGGSTLPSTKDVVENLKAGKIIPAQNRNLVLRVALSDMNLFDDDLPHLADLCELFPNCKEVDLSYNRFINPRSALGPIKRILSVQTLMRLIITATPLAGMDGRDLFLQLTPAELSKLVWIPTSALPYDNWQKIFDGDEAKDAKVEASKKAHAAHRDRQTAISEMAEVLRAARGPWPVTSQNAREVAVFLNRSGFSYKELALAIGEFQSNLSAFVHGVAKRRVPEKLVAAFSPFVAQQA